MRRRPAPGPAALLATLLAAVLALLAGCGSSGSGHASGSLSATPRAGLPTVHGNYGDKPTLTFPTSPPPGTVQKQVLRDGTGPVVAKGDLLVADYLGQVWRGAVFDNSYDRKQAAGFPIGVGKVIPGWDQTLVGLHAGSRVLLSLPPSAGYGASGNSQAGIKGTDTLVFVVDVVGSYSSTVHGDPHAAPQPPPTGGVQVTGALGAQPKVAVAKGAQPPKALTLTVLARGTGAPITNGLLVVQYEAVSYTGAPAGSTWTDHTPAGVPVGGSGGQPGVFDQARGVPLGSRVLVEVPGQDGQPAIAAVADLIAQPKTAKETG